MSEWISVKDRLPDLCIYQESRNRAGRLESTFHTSDLVLTYIPKGIVSTSSIQVRWIVQRRLSYLHDRKDNDNLWVHTGVTHWQPLPEPPKEKP